MALVNRTRSTGSLIGAELKEGNWERGAVVLKIELTAEGRDVLGDLFGFLNFAYQIGLAVFSTEFEGLTTCVVFAYFRTEIAENDAPQGVKSIHPRFSPRNTEKDASSFSVRIQN